MPKSDELTQNTPLRRDVDLVKELAAPAENASKPRGFRRHFEGYELGLLVVALVLTFAALALPRPSEPDALPLPTVDRLELARRTAAERVLVEIAERQGLPFDVRAVGEALRRFGFSSAHGEETSHDRDDIRTRAQALLGAHQSAALLSLRAVQTSYFLRALAEFEASGQRSKDLDELGGEFPDVARKNGWLDGRNHFVLDDSERRVLFELRWADLTGQRNAFPFTPTLDEWRVYYRFLLAHPESGTELDPTHAADSARLRYVGALARRDPEYPADLARGYLSYQLGDGRSAASSFRAHLAAHATGPYSLLARNSLIYLLQGQNPE